MITSSGRLEPVILPITLYDLLYTDSTFMVVDNCRFNGTALKPRWFAFTNKVESKPAAANNLLAVISVIHPITSQFFTSLPRLSSRSLEVLKLFCCTLKG